MEAPVGSPRISVVVPFYNNAQDLGDCLQSIAAQTSTNLEVIMVDDGSTDQSSEIARNWVEADPRFSLIRTTNGGPGKARNCGIERASGEYLAFVDGDDMLPPNAYELLLHTLANSGSDFASGAVNLISSNGVHPSPLHARAIKGRRIRTHVTKACELLYDITAWNKLFRKSFWDAHNLRFPEGMVWEDVQLMTRAHILASAVDVIAEYVYYWRERAAGVFSITQDRTNIQNLRDRVAAMITIDRFLAEHASAKLLREHQRKALVNDLWLYVRDLPRVSEDYLREYFDLANSYLEKVDKRVFRTLPATHKLAYHLTSKRMRQELLDFRAWQLNQQVTTIPVVRRFGRLYADLPFRTDQHLKIPSKVYRPHWRDLDPFVQVESVGWQRGDLVVTGLAYIPSIDMTKRRHTTKIVILRPRHRFRVPIVTVAASYRHPEATRLSGQDRHDYVWAGFGARIGSRWFRIAGTWLTGDWDCFIVVRAHGVWRPARLHTPALGPAGHPGCLEPSLGLQVRPTWVGRHLHVRVLHTPARLISIGRVGDELLLEVDLDRIGAERPAAAELVLIRQGGRATQTFSAAVTGVGETLRVQSRIPMTALQGAGRAGRALATHTAADGMSWDLYLKAACRGRVRVVFPLSLHEARYRKGAQEIAVERTASGDVVLAQRAPLPVLDEYSWDTCGRLRLAGSIGGPEGARLELMLCRRDNNQQHFIPCDRDGQRFSARVDVGSMPTFGESLPLRDGVWSIRARVGGSSGRVTEVVYDHARLGEVSHEDVSIGPKRYRLTTAGHDVPVITVQPRLRPSELSNFHRQALRRVFYPAQSQRPLRDALLFISWNGKQCTDNPFGIAAELRRRGDDRERIWVVNDYSALVPADDRAVLAGTEEYFQALARCRYVISNDLMPPSFAKRDGQVYLQTWHGTPLKKIGFDVDRPRFMSGASYFDRLTRDISKWDLLLSQNSFSTAIMRQAFRFGGEICEYGYPRNDLLFRGDVTAAEVRLRLGIPPKKRVILYAPTWRDNQYYASGRYRFDVRLDLERAWHSLGPDYVVLVRAHHHLANDIPGRLRPGFALDVTAYPDICELFMISDVLITDYSSTMFDFAVTGRPMLFFTYDLAAYRDELRGFYFDFEAEAPGPLLTNSDDVLAAVKDIDKIALAYSGAYQAFAEKYCSLDDGKAGVRVCGRLFQN